MLRLLNFSFNGDIHWVFLLQTSKSAIGFTGFVYQCRFVLENTKVDVKIMTSQQRLSRIVTSTFL